MVTIKIPATSANMGPGFDSMGIALNLYNTVSAEETNGGLSISVTDGSAKYLPLDERNLVYRSMKIVFEKAGYKPRGLNIILENNIPVTRGLGSSSAGIIGGLMAANTLLGSPFGSDFILNAAADIEGHPDNVAPALLGGMVVASANRKNVHYVKIPVGDEIKFAAIIPEFILSTRRAREVLPKFVPLKDAVINTGNAALMAASIQSGKFENIRFAIGDRLHQKYRSRLISGMERIFDLCYKYGALGVYLSGAGPAIVAIFRNGSDFEEKIFVEVEKFKKWNLKILECDNDGATVL